MSNTKVITPKVRFSYLRAFEPYAMHEGQDPKYSVSLIIPKKNKKAIATIESAIKAALEEGIAKFGGKIPKTYKSPLRDGDLEREGDEAYENCMFVNANSTRKPGVVDADLNPILDKDEIYSGCYGRASINFYAFNTAGNKGVAAGLQNLQMLEDGPRLSGGASAESDFGSADDDDDLM